VASAIVKHGGKVYIYYFTQPGIFPPVGTSLSISDEEMADGYQWYE
jgi:hypothetical protein